VSNSKLAKHVRFYAVVSIIIIHVEYVNNPHSLSPFLAFKPAISTFSELRTSKTALYITNKVQRYTNIIITNKRKMFIYNTQINVFME
jgi:hypothetical protein